MRPHGIIGLLLACVSATTLSAIDPLDSLRLPLPPPEDGASQVSLRVPIGGRIGRLDLERTSLRAPGFRVRIYRGPGDTVEVPAPPAASWTGVVRDDPGSRVAGGIGPAGWTLRIETSAGEVHWIRTAREADPSASPGIHRVIEGDPPFPGGRTCGLDARDHPHGPGPVSFSGAPSAAVKTGRGPAGPPSPLWSSCGIRGMKLAEIAYDVDHPYYVNQGSDLAATIANVEAHTAVVDAFYARDALITYRITEILVREAPFYFPDASASLLDLFRDEWNANQTAVPRDIAHLMTGQPAPGLAGLAYVGVVCNLAWVYGWSVDSSGVLGHELGHNWNAGHCHDTSPCNNMCGACLNIGPNTKDIILAFRDSRGCLDDEPPYTDPVPPYAHPDRLTLDPEQVVARDPVEVDVLLNDHDANCDELVIETHDDRSDLGGFVELLSASDPSRRDRLAYVPPCAPFSGTDGFGYTVADSAAETASTEVTVRLRTPELSAIWPLDDGAGSSAVDATGRGRDGSLVGGASWTAGALGGALALDGVDGAVSLPGLGIEGSEATITGWIRRDGAQAPWAGIVFSRASGTTAGLNFGEANELRYHWAGGQWDWDSGLVVPDGVWTFVALVVEPDQATIYMDDGTGLASSVHAVPHPRQTFAGEIWLGQDPTGGRWFLGAMDDIRFYDHALDAAAVASLAAGRGAADGPNPANGGYLSDPAAPLTWVPAPGADAYDVYFAQDWVAARDAGPGDPAHVATTLSPQWQPPLPLDEEGVYFWRVDTDRGGVVEAGDVWLFTVRSPKAGLRAAWRFEEGTGAIAADATERGRDGALQGGASWTSGPYGGAILLDGADGAVEIPALDMPGATATITAWIRRDGDQADWAGIVMSRDAGTTAAIDFGTANELRYHWANTHWDWDSGLVVPDGVWVLVALVVEPDRAWIHLHDGSLRSSEHVAGHATQTFAGSTWIGRDPGFTLRDFRGAVDEVRIYDRALSAAEIDALATERSPAEIVSPPDGLRLAQAPLQLRWVPAPGADGHDVYLGSDPTAVAAADPGSPEYQGAIAEAFFDLPRLAEGSTWFWRVDERFGPSRVAGPVWRFAVEAGLATALRVRRATGGEPVLAWRELGNHRLYEVARCTAAGIGGCTPALVETVGPYQASWTDPSAGGSLLWYGVVDRNPCAP